MKIKKHHKLIIGFVLIFFSGLLIGAAATYLITRQNEETGFIKRFKKRTLKVMTKELSLTPEQQLEVKKFLDKALERMKRFRKRHTPEIIIIIQENNRDLDKILTPEQWKIYERYRDKTLDRFQKDMPHNTQRDIE